MIVKTFLGRVSYCVKGCKIEKNRDNLLLLQGHICLSITVRNVAPRDKDVKTALQEEANEIILRQFSEKR